MRISRIHNTKSASDLNLYQIFFEKLVSNVGIKLCNIQMQFHLYYIVYSHFYYIIKLSLRLHPKNDLQIQTISLLTFLLLSIYLHFDSVCIPITFDNPIKACFFLIIIIFLDPPEIEIDQTWIRSKEMIESEVNFSQLSIYLSCYLSILLYIYLAIYLSYYPNITCYLFFRCLKRSENANKSKKTA